MPLQLSLFRLLLIVFSTLPTYVLAQSNIDFLHNGEKFYSKNGVGIDTVGIFEIRIINGKALIQDPKKPIGTVLTLARANRPIGSPLQSPDFKDADGAFNWFMRRAKPGDRLVLELTNTSKAHIYSIPLL